MIAPIRPSAVTDWLRCPRLWWYKEQGWEAPPSAWSPERLMGTAVHAGIAAYWRGVNPRTQTSFTLTASWPDDAPPEYDMDVLEAQALTVLDAVLHWIMEHMPERDTLPVMVEQPLGADGHTTPDLVTREQADIKADMLVVTDWKVSMSLPADRLLARLEGIERTWQFLHYCWAVGEHLQEPVRMFRKVVIAAGPKILVREATFQPTAPMLAAWLKDAEAKWGLMHQMQAGTLYPWRQETGCFMYGPKWRCPMYDACWTCLGDEEQMAQFLVRAAR